MGIITPIPGIATFFGSIIIPSEGVITPITGVATLFGSIIIPVVGVSTFSESVITPSEGVATFSKSVIIPGEGVATLSESVITPNEGVARECTALGVNPINKNQRMQGGGIGAGDSGTAARAVPERCQAFAAAVL